MYYRIACRRTRRRGPRRSSARSTSTATAISRQTSSSRDASSTRSSSSECKEMLDLGCEIGRAELTQPRTKPFRAAPEAAFDRRLMHSECQMRWVTKDRLFGRHFDISREGKRGNERVQLDSALKPIFSWQRNICSWRKIKGAFIPLPFPAVPEEGRARAVLSNRPPFQSS